MIGKFYHRVDCLYNVLKTTMTADV